ncbi:uncharacterized protein [Miscanthus floridulus]|uniref:uncharacterized protein n=1 Tax=Miscanthus floridulus TaxID=154761 RepID=UPI0034589E3F
MLAQGLLHNSEVAQHIKEATGEANIMFLTLGHPVMWPDMGFVELPVGLVFQDSVTPLLEHTAMRAANHAMDEQWKKKKKDNEEEKCRSKQRAKLYRKRPAEVPTLVPLKALKVNPGSTAHWVAEAQAALQRGAASVRADPKKPATQGGDAEAAPTHAGEGAPPLCDGEARGSVGAEAPLTAEATGIEVPGVSQAGAEAAEAGAPGTIEAAMAEAEAPRTTEATVAEARAPGTTEADVIAARPLAQEVETKAAEASVAPLVQGPPSLRESAREVEVLPISSDDVSRAQEMADAKVAESEAEVTRAAEASVAVQTVLETEIREHDTLKGAARIACEALEVDGVQSGSSLGSRLIALSSQVRERLRGALHTGINRALAVIASHYVGVDLQAISDGYVLPDDDAEADEVVTKLLEAVGGPSTALATLFVAEPTNL